MPTAGCRPATPESTRPTPRRRAQQRSDVATHPTDPRIGRCSQAPRRRHVSESHRRSVLPGTPSPTNTPPSPPKSKPSTALTHNSRRHDRNEHAPHEQRGPPPSVGQRLVPTAQPSSTAASSRSASPASTSPPTTPSNPSCSANTTTPQPTTRPAEPTSSPTCSPRSETRNDYQHFLDSRHLHIAGSVRGESGNGPSELVRCEAATSVQSSCWRSAPDRGAIDRAVCVRVCGVFHWPRPGCPTPALHVTSRG